MQKIGTACSDLAQAEREGIRSPTPLGRVQADPLRASSLPPAILKVLSPGKLIGQNSARSSRNVSRPAAEPIGSEASVTDPSRLKLATAAEPFSPTVTGSGCSPE